TTRVIDANGNVTYTVYDDVDHEARVYPGWNSTTCRPTGPTIVVREDRANNYAETLTISAQPAVDMTGRPTGGESISSLQSLSRNHFNEGGQLIETDAYFSFTGISYSTNP